MGKLGMCMPPLAVAAGASEPWWTLSSIVVGVGNYVAPNGCHCVCAALSPLICGTLTVYSFMTRVVDLVLLALPWMHPYGPCRRPPRLPLCWIVVDAC
jgi:hypothetical protein